MAAKKIGRQIPRDFNLHWGKGQIIEEACVIGQYHQPSIQLLEFEDGSLSIRFCYYSPNGMFQRSPLIIGVDDLARLRSVISEHPKLRAILGDLVKSD